MPKADRVLFAAFLRLTHRFRHEGLPLTGVVGNGVTCYQLDFAATLASAFHRPPPGLGFAGETQLTLPYFRDTAFWIVAITLGQKDARLCGCSNNPSSRAGGLCRGCQTVDGVGGPAGNIVWRRGAHTRGKECWDA